LILQKIAIHLRPQSAMTVVPPPPAPAPAAPTPAANNASTKSAPVQKPAAKIDAGLSFTPPSAPSAPAKPAAPPPAAQNRAPAHTQPDFGSTTSILSPLAVNDILSFELVDDDSEAFAPAHADPILALSPQSEELDGHYDISELALEEELDAPQTILSSPAPAVLVPPMDIPVLSAAPVVARAAPAVEPAAKKPEPAAPPPTAPPVLSPTDVAIKALREPSNAYAAMRYGAIPVEKKSSSPVAAPAPAPRPSVAAPKLNSHVDPAFKDLALSVQLLSKLRPGGRTRRYEVLLRNKQDPKALVAANEIMRSLDKESDLDGFVVSQLLTWLAENPKASEKEPLTFSINLSPRALHDERFPEFVSSWLRKTGVAAESIGFELAESVCVEHKEQALRFVAACEKLGCFIVLDDFSMETRAIEFLRFKAIKLIKLDPRLTNEAMKDKLAQAMVIAISQAAKVLGVHCAAKKIESQMVRRWITAIGFDFAQGTLFEGPQHVNDLLLPPKS
jgi:EAL domain-containing protein (putative c-di-GMP-specific phosphodiesterase class I)